MRRSLWAVAVLVIGSCAAEVPAPEPARPVDALVWGDGSDLPLAGMPIAVGGREGAEGEVLGWLLAEALAATGAEVEAPPEPLGLSEAREAQLAGLVDLYWEHTGAAWVSLLRQAGPSPDPEQLYEDLRDDDLQENGIAWLQPAPADAGPAVVASAEVLEDLEVVGLADLAALLDEAAAGAVVCIPENGQPLDPGALAALAEAGAARLRPRVVNPVDPDDLADLVEDGTFCPFGVVDHLDPVLDEVQVAVIEDDLEAFVPQNPAVTVRGDTLDLAPAIAEVVEPVAERLDTASLRALVGRVAAGSDARAEARAWLIAEGLATAG